MELKRLYHRILNDAGDPMLERVTDDNGQYVIDDETGLVKTRVRVMRDADGVPIVRGVHIRRLPKNGKQNFSPRFIGAGIDQGWLSMSETGITIHCEERGQVRFYIDRKPGRRCLTCGAELPGTDKDPSGILARQHCEEAHDVDDLVTTARWPAGYDVVNAYMTTIEG